GFTAQGGHGVKVAAGAFAQFVESTLDGGELGNMAHLTGYAEGFGVGKFRFGQQSPQSFQGTSLMGDHLGAFGVAPQRDHLHSECTDVDAHVRHNDSVLRDRLRRFPCRRDPEIGPPYVCMPELYAQTEEKDTSFREPGSNSVDGTSIAGIQRAR